MASQYIPRRSGTALMIQRQNAASIQIDSADETLKYMDGDGVVRKIGAPLTELVTGATRVVTAKDNGKTLLLNAATAIDVQLPPTTLGFTITVGVLVAAGGGVVHKITPVAADKIMGTNSAGTALDGADGIALVDTQATAAKSHHVTLVGDGVDGWLAIDTYGAWVKAS
jgi:hypothetical protein